MGELRVAYLIVAVPTVLQLNLKEKLSLVIFLVDVPVFIWKSWVTEQTVLSTKIYARVMFCLRILWDLGGWFPAELPVV